MLVISQAENGAIRFYASDRAWAAGLGVSVEKLIERSAFRERQPSMSAAEIARVGMYEHKPLPHRPGPATTKHRPFFKATHK